MKSVEKERKKKKKRRSGVKGKLEGCSHSMGVVCGVMHPEVVQRVVYKIGQMEILPRLRWTRIISTSHGMEGRQNRLQETLSQLNEHHSGIEDKADQKHIDVLTVVLGEEEMFSFSFFFLPKHANTKGPLEILIR